MEMKTNTVFAKQTSGSAQKSVYTGYEIMKSNLLLVAKRK